MAALETLGANQEGNAARQDIEVSSPVVVIGKEGVIKRHRLTCQTQVPWFFKRAMQDQIGQDSLLLLPPRLAVVPDKAVPLLTGTSHALHHVIPASALAVHANRRHDLGNLSRQGRIALAWTQVMDAHQIPGNLQIVTDDCA